KKAEAYQAPQANHLVMGPWWHGGWSRADGDHLGPVQFNVKTAPYFREQIEFPFFERHLKGVGAMDHPKAWVFETGTNRWRKYDPGPPGEAGAKSLYFQDGGRLAFDPPPTQPSPAAGGGDGVGVAFDEFVSDPAKPVPYLDKTAIGMQREYMTA